MPPNRYALHWDFQCASKERLNRPDVLTAEVSRIAKQAGMRLLGVQSYIIDEVSQPGPDESGVSTLGLITTSHIAIHAWPACSHVMLDLVSCRPFNLEKLCDNIHIWFIPTITHSIYAWWETVFLRYEGATWWAQRDLGEPVSPSTMSRP